MQAKVIVSNELSSDINTTSIRETCERLNHENFDHDYHIYWIEPNYHCEMETSTLTSIEQVNNQSQAEIKQEAIGMHTNIATSTSRKCLQVDTFPEQMNNLTEIKMRQQQKLVHDLTSKVKVLKKRNQGISCAKNILNGSVQFYTGLPNKSTLKHS